MKLTEPYRVMNEKSLYQRRDRKKEAFVPQAVAEVTEQADSEEMNEYVLKPLYTQKEIREFRKQNEQEGNFISDERHSKIHGRSGKACFLFGGMLRKLRKEQKRLRSEKNLRTRMV